MSAVKLNLLVKKMSLLSIQKKVDLFLFYRHQKLNRVEIFVVIIDTPIKSLKKFLTNEINCERK